jgi:hypothetical protein
MGEGLDSIFWIFGVAWSSIRTSNASRRAILDFKSASSLRISALKSCCYAHTGPGMVKAKITIEPISSHIFIPPRVECR